MCVWGGGVWGHTLKKHLTVSYNFIKMLLLLYYYFVVDAFYQRHVIFIKSDPSKVTLFFPIHQKMYHGFHKNIKQHQITYYNDF